MSSRCFFSDDALDRLVEVAQRNGLRLAAGSEQRSLVGQVGEIGAGEARRERRDLVRIDVGREAQLAGVDLDDLDAVALVGAVDQDLSVEATGAQ